MSSRRSFLKAGVALSALPLPAAASPALAASCQIVSMNGAWDFRLDPDGSGWRTVNVPHTWQVEQENAGYRGVAWYRRAFFAPEAWRDLAVRIEFEAVFHSAVVSLNGAEVGRHIGKGYTAFVLDLWPHLRFGAVNTLTVRVDNAFSETMLPRGRSSDWAHDGGVYRPVQLIVTPKVFVETVAIDAEPDLATGDATVTATATVRNVSGAAWSGPVTLAVAEEASGLPAGAAAAEARVAAGARAAVTLGPVKIAKARLWHFDHPHLYDATVTLPNGHSIATAIGIRKIETRDCAFFLNGERIRPMGVERMAGSNPEYGMAEPLAWIEHDQADMRELNCVYTRVHWPQDRRLLDWCDRHGMLIQTEVPTWGPDTFKGMHGQPSPEILNNGLEQLREMIARDRNHPCIFSWGVCNEIGGQNPAAAQFARTLYAESKRLDPKRLVTYASHSLRTTPGKDVAGEMDYVMFNEYYGSWYPGGPEVLARNLDEIHAAFPGKAIVISEYGYCACTADRPEGDAHRIDTMLAHDRVFRERDWIAGLIFFDYNDYRTHVGDRGAGAAQQRVHGVVDVYGARKPSWLALRDESSPVESIAAAGTPAALTIKLKTRASVPAYELRGYRVRGVAYGFGAIPVERAAAALPSLKPGQSAEAALRFTQPGIAKIQVDVLRPDGVSARTAIWEY